MLERRLLPILALLLCVTPIALAQKKPPAPAPGCPKVSVTSPDLATIGDTIKITATVTGGDKNVTPTYNWTVSDGAIESGQGTATINVDTSGVVSGFITATVDVGGYDRECMTASSSTTSVEAKKDEPKKDEKPAPQKPPR